MFFELRQYEIKPGCQEAWVKLMEEEIIPFQVSKGMVVLGSFVGEADESIYYWIRRFRERRATGSALCSCLRVRHVEDRHQPACW